MNRSMILILISLALFGISAVHGDEAEAVITLTAENFDAEIEKHDLLLVEFYAPWCGHCKRLAPEYEKAATDLAKDNLFLAKVDADEEQNKPLAARFEIRGFPTLKLFRKGGSAPIDYNGGRTAAEIVSYMKKQSSPVVSELKSDDIETFSQSDKVVVIGFFQSKDDAEYAKFAEIAQSLRDSFMFGAVFGDSDANAKYEVTAPAVILFKKFDEGKNVFSSEQLGDLPNLLKLNSIPLMDEIGPENYRTYVESTTPLAYLFVDLQAEGQKKENVDKVYQIVKDTKGKINWVYIDWSKYAKHSERLGLSGTVVPAIAIEDPVSGKHWAFDETAPITTEAVKAWIDQFIAGTLEPTIKSEPVPEKNDGPVTILVAKNFDQIVKDETKDVLVEFYAPWCGHCKKLSPIFDELGTALKGVESVVIAKIDATANDVDSSLEIRGFPTLKFFPANAKATPVEYSGDRSLKDLLQFVHKQASKSFALPEVQESAHEEHDEL